MAYIAPRWLPGPHSQTIWPAVISPRFGSRSALRYRRERWKTPDNDFIDLDFSIEPDAQPAGMQCKFRPTGTAVNEKRPLLVIFHGLEGCSSSHYAMHLCEHALALGWRAVVPMFRGCSGEPNLAPRAYHSGDSAEIDWILRRLHREQARNAPIFAIGVSLGGNALAKWLGEQGSQAGFVSAAAVICAPQDLQAGAQALSTGFNRVYTANFLKTLKQKSLDKLQRHPGLFDRERMLSARNFFDFDDAVTAPMHGFASCYDYWTKSSCRQFLPGIEVPTLVLNALNDPFVPAAVLARPDQVSRMVKLDYPSQGGHVGFPSGRFPGRFKWIPDRVLGFLSSQIGAQSAQSQPPMQLQPSHG